MGHIGSIEDKRGVRLGDDAGGHLFEQPTLAVKTAVFQPLGGGIQVNDVGVIGVIKLQHGVATDVGGGVNNGRLPLPGIILMAVVQIVTTIGNV